MGYDIKMQKVEHTERKKKETGLNSIWGCLVQPTYKL